jgi:CheY-like chemotaxis protein
MNKTHPIIIIEDDLDDQQLLIDVFKELGYPNELIFFEDGEEALQFFIDKETEPFIIFSDINLPTLNGVELTEKVYNN